MRISVERDGYVLATCDIVDVTEPEWPNASEARWTLSDDRALPPLRMLNTHPDTHPLDCVTSAVQWLEDWFDDNPEEML